jgi:hypothetical protein
MGKRRIVAFHIGRGGRFNNQGNRTFIGEYEINDSRFINDLFTRVENIEEILKKVEELELEQDYIKSLIEEEKYDEVEKLTGIKVGELIYITDTGNPVGLTVMEAETGIGKINIDHDYDTTYTKYLDEIDENELSCIKNTNEWNKDTLIEESPFNLSCIVYKSNFEIYQNNIRIYHNTFEGFEEYTLEENLEGIIDNLPLNESSYCKENLKKNVLDKLAIYISPISKEN